MNGKAAGLRSIYYTAGAYVPGTAGEVRYVEDSCPAGTLPVSGSFTSDNDMISVVHSDLADTNLDDKPDGWGVAAKFSGPDTLYVFATCIASNAGVFPARVAGGSDGLTRVERLNGR